MMPLIISFSVFIFFFNPQQVLCFDPAFDAISTGAGPDTAAGSPSQNDLSPPFSAGGSISFQIPTSLFPLHKDALKNSLFSFKPELFRASAIPGDNPEVKKTCSSTDQPLLCEKFLSPLFNPDTPVVLEKAINETAFHLKLAMEALTKLANAPIGELGKPSSGIEDCKQSYQDASENLENAKNAIANNDIGTINSMLSAATTDFSDCNDFLDNPTVKMLGAVLSNLVSTCLVIAASMKK
ncbi:uncharacterized protein LOC123221894 [Mangifera indica]|uniref:uncharacterized protein LOC123221894 n=1 Tax=Mangifera indica TaxID=29780 RepID=UPI001CF9D0FC|nr:uncharacterized protein LOC123221894 [Mangifera indica]